MNEKIKGSTLRIRKLLAFDVKSNVFFVLFFFNCLCDLPAQNSPTSLSMMKLNKSGAINSLLVCNKHTYAIICTFSLPFLTNSHFFPTALISLKFPKSHLAPVLYLDDFLQIIMVLFLFFLRLRHTLTSLAEV